MYIFAWYYHIHNGQNSTKVPVHGRGSNKNIFWFIRFVVDWITKSVARQRFSTSIVSKTGVNVDLRLKPYDWHLKRGYYLFFQYAPQKKKCFVQITASFRNNKILNYNKIVKIKHNQIETVRNLKGYKMN